MLNLFFSRAVATVAACLALGLSAVPAQAGPYSNLFVFGDSLSDGAGGNNANPLAPNQGGLLTPDPYVDGHFSNGKVAVEYLAEGLGLDAAHTYNFAIGGARTGADGQFPFTGLATQVLAFSGLAPFLGDLSGGLFSVWAGANDFRDALALGPNAPTAFGGIFTNLGNSIQTLYGLGAREFLLPNLPDIGLTPEGLASGNSAGISTLSFAFNQALQGFYSGLSAALPGSDFHYVDVFAAQHQLLAAAPVNGLTNTTTGCLLTLLGDPAGLDCSSAFYVDNVHPTTQVHEVLGQAMFAAAVPEPAGLLLTATALLGLLAASARRRRA